MKTTIQCDITDTNREFSFVGPNGDLLMTLTVFCNGYLNADIHAQNVRGRLIPLEIRNGKPRMIHQSQPISLVLSDGESHDRVVTSFHFHAVEK